MMDARSLLATRCFWSVAILFGSPLFAGEVVDPAKAKPSDDGQTLWYDCRDVGVEGQGWSDTERPFDRLPKKAKELAPKKDWNLGYHAAGLCVRFSTDAPSLRLRWTVVNSDLAMPHMPATGVSGLDLYGRDAAGQWRFMHNGRPHAQANETSCSLNGSKEYLLYLPLYNGIKSLEIGAPKGHALLKPDVAELKARPVVVFYGSSITQGGCASRPGMAFPAIVGRELDVAVINLGFSGSGVMEMSMADLLAELDPAVYVLDTLGNMSAEQVTERVDPFVRRLREAHAETPIVLAEDASLKAISPTPRGAALKAACDKLTSAGVKGVHFLSNHGMHGDDGEGTVDGVHPNDLGMSRHAQAFAAGLRPLVKAGVSK